MTEGPAVNVEKKGTLVGMAKWLADQVENAEDTADLGKKVEILNGIKKVSKKVLTLQHPETPVESFESSQDLSEDVLRATWDEVVNKEIVYKSISELTFVKDLPIIPMTARDEDVLRDDIKEKGILYPLIITANNEIIDGRHRYIMAKKIGLTEVPCVVLADGLHQKQLYDLFFKLNLARRQMDKETREWVVAQLLKVHNWEQKRPGRPPKVPKTPKPADGTGEAAPATPLSQRDIARALHVSKGTAQRAIEKAKEKTGLKPMKAKREYDSREFIFKITFGSSVEREATFIGLINEKLKEYYQFLDKNKGDTLEVKVICTLGTLEE